MKVWPCVCAACIQSKATTEQSYNRTNKAYKQNTQTTQSQTTKKTLAKLPNRNTTLYFTSLLLPDDPPDAPEEKEITKRKTYISNK